jgi:hypothetical protein
VRNPAQARILTQQQIARVEGLCLKSGTITRNEKPVTDFVAQQANRADRGKFPAQARVRWVGALREYKPDTVVSARLLVITQHTGEPVTEIDGETGEYAAYLGIHGRQGIKDKGVRRLCLRFGRARHGVSRKT